MADFLKISNNIGSAGSGRALPPNVQFDTKDNLLRARFRGPFTGLDTTSSITNMDLMSLRVADNCNIEEDGSIAKRQGFIPKLDNPWGALNITQGLNVVYSDTPGSGEIKIFGHEGTPNSGAIAGIVPDYASAPIDQLTGLSNNRPCLFQFDDRVFFWNGVEALLINHFVPQPVGIDAPVNAPTLNTTINGDLTVGAIYTYAYTYYNSGTGAESSPSPLLITPAVSANPNDGFRLNVTPSPDLAKADIIRVYRTVGNGSVLQFEGDTPGNSTTYDSTIADSGLGREVVLDNSRYTIFGEPRYAWVAESRIYATAMASNPNRVIVSAIYSTGPMPESFPAKNFVDCQSSRGNADNNLGGGIAGDTVVVLKRDSIGRIEKLGADTTTESEDPVIFAYREISRAVTGISHFAACNVLSEYVWVGRDNIYATDGINVRSIADKIQTDIKSFNFIPDDSFSAFNDLEEKRVYFAVKSSPNLIWPDIVLVGHYSSYPEFYWTVYKPGLNNNTHPGIQPGCFFETTLFDDNQRRVIFGNTLGDGQLYQMNTGNDDDGSPIAFRVRFAPISFGFEEEEKLYIEDQIRAIGSGSLYNITATSIYDYLISETDQQNLSLVSNGNLWGSFLWGVGLWGQNTPLKLRHFSHKKAYAKQLQLQQLGAGEPVIIYGFEVLARPTAWRA